MIIAISGSVGSGKTTISQLLTNKLNEIQKKRGEFSIKQFECVPLNSWAMDFKEKDISELQTFDFNLDKLVFKANSFINENSGRNIVFEGHFAHFINPDLVDFLFVINRDLKELKKEYEKRGYNEQKIKDNLEVESFNLCFYEALEEGFEEEKQVFVIDNSLDLDSIVNKIIETIGFQL